MPSSSESRERRLGDSFYEPAAAPSANGEYERLDQSGGLFARDVSTTLGSTLAKVIYGEYLVLKNLSFPWLRFPALTKDAYSGPDYSEIALRLSTATLRVWLTREDHNFAASYDWEKNHFVVTPELAGEPGRFTATIVHEVTHAVQDMKKWRMSPTDMELDAHFAQALFLVRSGRESESHANLRLVRFVIAAKEYIADPRYLQSMSFAQFREKLKLDVELEYVFRLQQLYPDRDTEDIQNDLRKRQRLDGVPG